MSSSEDPATARKSEAMRIAAQEGHSIGNWRLEGTTWHGSCTEKQCSARVSVGAGPHGGIAGPTIRKACPYKSRSTTVR